MYATCLFCQKDLGRNESFETFPVGRRLAFDAAKGRLWVVCSHCERWNLSPLEERWEAIEQAERYYRDSKRRVATDNIGLSKLRDGTTLVRIGEPLRPEFAAWRYGDQFGRRRRRQLAIVGAGLGALGVLVVGGVTAGVGIGGFGWLISRAGMGIVRGSGETVVATIKTPQGETLRVRRRHLLETTIEPGAHDPLAVNLRYAGGQAYFEGQQAMHIASRIIPAANRFGGSKDNVASAVDQIEREGSAEAFLERLASVAAVTTRPKFGAGPLTRRQRRSQRWNNDWSTGVFAMSTVQRLALEMALHEEAERSAMEGELHVLETAWREAEEIAAISDSLLLPSAVDKAFEAIKRRASKE
ncbi:MAG TPA: hypothetical protein VGP95_18320 [Gemmatimonadaceae bacterium]|jgi:hypothetical protein|nr:hypothetical protein [Gemmatimonadaceae bacterium]